MYISLFCYNQGLLPSPHHIYSLLRPPTCAPQRNRQVKYALLYTFVYSLNNSCPDIHTHILNCLYVSILASACTEYNLILYLYLYTCSLMMSHAFFPPTPLIYINGIPKNAIPPTILPIVTGIRLLNIKFGIFNVLSCCAV